MLSTCVRIKPLFMSRKRKSGTYQVTMGNGLKVFRQVDVAMHLTEVGFNNYILNFQKTNVQYYMKHTSFSSNITF